jgi:glycosyltransferase involved in cell wall biosynthesis
MVNVATKKVLIICYSFPPYPGIGGRRWAKFAKYFAKEGVECHIINAYNYSKNKSVWNNDIENPLIIIHPLKFRFQYWMGLFSKSLLYRSVSKLLRTGINFTKYSPYFSTSLSRILLQNRCLELIKQHQIGTVIVSGDPYLNFYVSELKKKCNVKVILDYRDTWNDRPYYHLNKFHKLTLKQRLFFEYCENTALKSCDQAVCVYEPMIDLLSVRSGKSKERFLVIPNGFDKDDYALIPSKPLQNKIISLYYGGNVMPGGLSDYLIRFLKLYSELQTINKGLWEKFCIQINGNTTPSFEMELKKLKNPNIIFEKGLVPNKLYVENLSSSSFGILSNPDEYIDCLFITKTFDYLYLEKPIIYLGKKGKVSEFIESNNIGFVFNPDEDSEIFFQKLADTPPMLNFHKEVHELIEKNYDISNLSRRYLSLLDTIRSTTN